MSFCRDLYSQSCVGFACIFSAIFTENATRLSVDRMQYLQPFVPAIFTYIVMSFSGFSFHKMYLQLYCNIVIENNIQLGYKTCISKNLCRSYLREKRGPESSPLCHQHQSNLPHLLSRRAEEWVTRDKETSEAKLYASGLVIALPYTLAR